jgi:hypothetical protein
LDFARGLFVFAPLASTRDFLAVEPVQLLALVSPEVTGAALALVALLLLLRFFCAVEAGAGTVLDEAGAAAGTAERPALLPESTLSGRAGSKGAMLSVTPAAAALRRILWLDVWAASGGG